MHFRLLAVALLLLSTFAYSQGRRPAVEDFVGIEVEQPETPANSGSLYNLEQDMNQLRMAQETPKKAQLKTSHTATDSGLGFTTFLAALLILALPLVSWLFVMNHLRNKATQESESNIKVLESYRKNRELAKKSEHSERKAS